jgi:glycosyltransferase involved in cell wall biosynthesis
LFRKLASQLDPEIFFGHCASPGDQSKAGFGTPFDWDLDLLEGYSHRFLRNVADPVGLGRFAGIDAPEISGILRSGRFGALLVMGWNYKFFLQAVAAAKRIGIPVLVRGDSQLSTPRSFAKMIGKALFYPPFLRLFDVALCVGQRSRAYFIRYNYPLERVFFSPHCVDNAWFAAGASSWARNQLRNKLGIKEHEKVLLFAGKLVPSKRPLDLVDACALLRKRGTAARVLVAGAGTLEAKMDAKAKSLGVPLVHLGFQNQTEMPAAYAASDLLVLPSSAEETWGLVANEALACSRPIVVSDSCGCAPDLTDDRTVGQSFPEGNISALALAIGDVLNSPPSPAAIAAKSAAYSTEAAAIGVMQALAYLANGRRH